MQSEMAGTVGGWAAKSRLLGEDGDAEDAR